MLWEGAVDVGENNMETEVKDSVTSSFKPCENLVHVVVGGRHEAVERDPDVEGCFLRGWIFLKLKSG